MANREYVDYSRLPEHIRGGAKRYIEDGILPGSFLCACFCNRLVESFALADDINRESMFDIAWFLYNEAPIFCRGSSQIMADWCKSGGINGLQKKEIGNDGISK